jgi:hypothetical protein
MKPKAGGFPGFSASGIPRGVWIISRKRKSAGIFPTPWIFVEKEEVKGLFLI